MAVQWVPDRLGEPSAHVGVAKLTDFGGARLAGEDVLTRTGDVLGTFAYMAPEQSDGGQVGEAADLYSLALVLYESFSGINPVRGANAAATARRIGTRLEPLERRRRDLPRVLTRGIDAALVPSSRARGTIEDFLNLPDAFSDVPHRLFGVRQREQVMQIAATHASPAQMVRNPRRLETTCGATQRVEIGAIERVTRADR